MRLYLPQFVLHEYNNDLTEWIPSVQDYGGGPYMVVGDSLEQILTTIQREPSELPENPYRVVHMGSGELYKPNESATGLVLIEDSEDLEGADKRWFDFN